MAYSTVHREAAEGGDVALMLAAGGGLGCIAVCMVTELLCERC